MGSALKRCFDSAGSRLGAPLAGALCAGIALAAAAWFGGSAAGITAVGAAAAAWLVWARRRAAAAAEGDDRLRLVSSISLPGGGRVHEVRLRGSTLVVGCHGGRIALLSARDDGDADA